MNIETPIAAPAPRSRFEEAVLEIEARVARTPVRLQPFPHLVVDDLLPPPLRRMLDEYWPARTLMGESNYSARGEKKVSRLAGISEGRERQFWNTLRALTTRTGRAARARLERHLGQKFRLLLGPDWRRQLGDFAYEDNDAMLAHYTGKIDLPPHIDNVRVVVNGFVYLGDAGEDQAALRGTMFYRSLGFAWPTNRDIPKSLREHLLREAGEVGWRDNRLLAYINGPTSFHGVPPHDIGDGRRRLLMFGSLLDKQTAERVLDPALR